MTELRNYGDGKTVVVYTEDRATATKLGNRKRCFKIVPYEQTQKNKVVLVGVDYYFPKSEKRTLLRFCGG